MASTSVALTTVQATIARALAFAPADRGRIEKAAALISFGYVEQTAPDAFSVRSLTDAGVTYTVRPDSCECAGRRHYPGRRCSHEWACRIVLSAEMAADAEREQAARARASANSVALAFANAHRRAA